MTAIADYMEKIWLIPADRISSNCSIAGMSTSPEPGHVP
jgi:hypothetical protein